MTVNNYTFSVSRILIISLFLYFIFFELAIAANLNFFSSKITTTEIIDFIKQRSQIVKSDKDENVDVEIQLENFIINPSGVVEIFMISDLSKFALKFSKFQLKFIFYRIGI